MKCKRAKEQGILYLYGELPETEQREIELHMEGCPSCAEDLAYTRDVFAEIDRADTADVPEAAWDKCWGQIATGVSSPPKARAGWKVPALRWVPAAAAVILVFAVGLYIGHFWPSSQAPTAVDVAQAPEFSKFTLEDHFDNLKPLLAEYANQATAEAPGDRVLVDRRLIQALLVQNYMLMRLVAQNDPQAADLLEDIDLVLREIKNMESGDPDAPGMIRRLIQSRDILFKINVLQKL
jgi:hypothetical protein